MRLHLKRCRDGGLGPLGHDVVHRERLPVHEARCIGLLDANKDLVVLELDVWDGTMVALEKDLAWCDVV